MRVISVRNQATPASRRREAMLLAKLAGDPAKRAYNTMFAENLIALAKTLRAPGIAARAT